MQKRFEELQRQAAAGGDNETATSNVKVASYTINGQEVSEEEYRKFLEKKGFSDTGDIMEDLFGNSNADDTVNIGETNAANDDPFAPQNLYPNENKTTYNYYTSDNTSENSGNAKSEILLKIGIVVGALTLIALIASYL